VLDGEGSLVIERQSLDSSIAESEKKKKENRSNELKLREQKLRKREEELKIGFTFLL
jgi:hypothetical protein